MRAGARKEVAMKSLEIACVALIAAWSLGYAHAYPDFPTGSDMAGISGVYTVIDSNGRRIAVVRNANACAPFDADAVWGRTPSASPLGYHCYPPNPNR
jgi:hypothetical protein